MLTFWQWLTEDRYTYISPSVVQSYETAFRQALKNTIAKTQDPNLRSTFEKMLNCPIQDQRGNCRKFAEYIVDALIKNGLQDRFDMESALAYVFEKMMMEKSPTGEAKGTVFSDFDETRPYRLGENPLQARFMNFLAFAIRNIRKGKIPRLAKVEARPAGTVSLGLGRSREGDPAAGLSPEHVPARASTEQDFGEIVADLLSSLRQKELAYGLPLADFFQSMLSGKRSDALRQMFGDRTARTARQVVLQTIQDYATETENYALLRLLAKMKEGEPAAQRMAVPTKPKLQPGKEKDFASIIAVIDRFDRPVGTADLGRYRRRWLEYPPRDASSGHRNRLEEVLATMTREGVLTATRTNKGAFVYSPGPNYQQYRLPVAG